jgi:hypothetical protein
MWSFPWALALRPDSQSSHAIPKRSAGSAFSSNAVYLWSRSRARGSSYLKRYFVHARVWAVCTRLIHVEMVAISLSLPGKQASSADAARLDYTQGLMDGNKGYVAGGPSSGTLLNMLELAEGINRACEHSTCYNTLS